MFPFNFPTQVIETFSCSVCTRKRATTQDVLSVEACQNVTPRPRQGFRIVDTPYLVVVNSCVVVTFKIGQTISNPPHLLLFISFMKKHSTSLKVTFDPSLLCRHSCRRCFSFRTTFLVFFFPPFPVFSTPVLPGDTTFFGPFPSVLFDCVDFPLFPLGLPLGFPLLLL